MIAPPRLHLASGQAVLSGHWTLAAMLPELETLRRQLAAAGEGARAWDLSRLERLDSAAAVLLWRTWHNAWPDDLDILPLHRQVIARVAELPPTMPAVPPRPFNPVEALGRQVLRLFIHAQGMIALFGQMLLDIVHLARHPREFPLRELSANMYKAGAQALMVTALVGFLIGVTLSYLSALQLRSLGADMLIVNILGIAIIRELGPVLVAVLVAGRSGSAMTAQIGVMRVTEEIDALSAMGVSRSLRVVLPKIIGLTLAMPLLVLWTSAVALLGGMLAALMQLDLSLHYFIESLPRTVPVANLYIGLGKGLVFGFVIALVACHFGLRVRPDTESLSTNTTRSVVTAITSVILVDALFAIFTRHLGVPTL